MRSGILAAGNWIRDHVKTIDAWPDQDGLSNILGHTAGNGGGPYNVLKDLSKMRAPFPLEGLGLIGDDADGRAILDDCRASGIGTGGLRMAPGMRTSSTDVMTVRGSGRRTFFHDRGANAHLGPGAFDFLGRSERIFYLGYLMLLDALDAEGDDGAPRARGVLRRAREAGMVTSADCVSAVSGRFRATVAPIIPEVDILFTNDFEAEQVAGLRLGRGEKLDRGAVEASARALARIGILGWVIVHFPEGACACSADGRILWQASVRVPADKVAGSAGAGDALAAGVLFGVHEGWPMERSLELGVCAAATSLLHPTCSESIMPHDGCVAFGHAHGFVAGR